MGESCPLGVDCVEVLDDLVFAKSGLEPREQGLQEPLDVFSVDRLKYLLILDELLVDSRRAVTSSGFLMRGSLS
jgi:hypothetical protein